MKELAERTTRQMLAQMSGAEVRSFLAGMSQRAVSIMLLRPTPEGRAVRLAVAASREAQDRKRALEDVVNVICWPTDGGGERFVVTFCVRRGK
jgi:hypothetical protein